MRMKKETKLKIGLVLLGIGLFLHFFSGENGFIRDNTIFVKRALRKNEIAEGKFKGVLEYEYHNLVVFDPHMTKEEMVDIAYMDYKKFKPSDDEDMMNILFTYGPRVSAYIRGYPEDLGFKLELEPGRYGRGTMNNFYFEMEEVEGKNGKTYKNYRFFQEEPKK